MGRCGATCRLCQCPADLWGFDPASSAWEELDPDGQVQCYLQILPVPR